MSYTKERFEMDPQSDVKPNPLGSHPVGTRVGAAVGAIAGGFAGKRVAEMIDPAAEDAYWRENHKGRPYAAGGSSYDEYGPAYRYGVESFGRYSQRDFDEFALSRGWNASRGTSSLDWDRAKHAGRAAWNRLSDRVERAIPGDSDRGEAP